MHAQHASPDSSTVTDPERGPGRAGPSAPGADLATLLGASMARHAALPAFVCAGKVLRFAQLDSLSAALAAHLLAQGLQRGDRVAVLLHNLPQLPVAVAAVLRVGLVLVNVPPALAPAEVRHLLKDSGARALVAGEDLLQRLGAAAEGLALRHVVCTRAGDLLGPLRGPVLNRRLRGAERSGSGPAQRWVGPEPVSWAEATRTRPRTAALPTPDADDIAVLQYTGGTTGPSRGAVLLHRNLVANLQQAAQWLAPALRTLPPDEQWITVGALPLQHVFGFTLVLLLGLHLGHCTLLVPDPEDTGALLRLLARHRFHAFPATNPLFQAVASHPDVDEVDWSTLRLSLGGATAVQPSTALLWLLKTGSPICQGYGLTEASPAVTCNPVDGSPYRGSLGYALPGTELALLDDEGRPVRPGAPGEIAVRGPQVMAGYWQRPDDTARAMTADGFLRTGDIGVFDADGALRLVDRKKDLIFASGFNVYPAEIESVVMQLGGVRACAAVGVPDALTGEHIKLVVARHDPASGRPGEAELRAHCEQHLAGYKRPRVVEFRESLPTSSTGKVLRRRLRDDG